jgi:hypothetical protein
VVEVILTANQQTEAFVVDEDGQRLPTEVFWAKERAARLARFGKLTPELFALKQTLGADELVEVTITINADLPQPELPTGIGRGEVPLARYEAWTKATINSHRGKIMAAKARLRAYLARNAVAVMGDPDEFPTMDVKIPAALLDAPETAGDDVLRIEKIDKSKIVLHGDYAGHGSMNAAAFSGGACAGQCAGGGLTVGVWEWDQLAQSNSPAIVGGIATNNSRINRAGPDGVVYLRPLSDCSTQSQCNVGVNYTHWCAPLKIGGPSKCIIGHTTWVAAAIGSSYPSAPYAYDSLVTGGTDTFANVAAGTSFGSAGAWVTRLLIANSNIASISQQIQFLVAPPTGAGATYVNRSQNLIPNEADWLGRNYSVFLANSSGNSGNTATVDCKNLSNGVCVGMYDYRTWNDLSTHRVNDDSSGGNFVVGVEKPHLLGPGSHSGGSSGLHMPNPGLAVGMMHSYFTPSGVLTQIKGTSFAAPAVVAVAILAHQYEGLLSALAYPAVNKAVLLAASQDANNDGPVGKGDSWSAQPSDAVDGAGQINMGRLKTILDNNQYAYADLTNASLTSCGANCRQKLLATIVAPADYVPRVALTYQRCMANSGSSPVLQNDLDLVVTANGSSFNCGTFVTSNTTGSETEMLEYGLCPGARTYSVYVRIKNGASLAQCSASDTIERVGVAWNLVYKALVFGP